MQIRITLFAALLSLVGLQAAHAATLYSPILKARYNSLNRTFQCSVLNVSGEPKVATIWIMKSNGTVLKGPSAPTTVPPEAAVKETIATPSWAYCKVQVTGLKTDWRGAFELQTYVNGNYETNVSVPLQ